MSLAVAEWRAGHWGEGTPMGRRGWNPRLLIRAWTAVLFSGAARREDILKTMATVVAGQRFGPTYFAAFSCSEWSSDQREMIKLFDPLSQDLRTIPAFPSWAIYCATVGLWTHHHGIKKKKTERALSRNSSKKASRTIGMEVVVKVKAKILSAPTQDLHSLTLYPFEARWYNSSQGREITSVDVTFHRTTSLTQRES